MLLFHGRKDLVEELVPHIFHFWLFTFLVCPIM